MDREPPNAERVAVRWLGRWALESREATLTGLLEATVAMSALAHEPGAGRRCCGGSLSNREGCFSASSFDAMGRSSPMGLKEIGQRISDWVGRRGTPFEAPLAQMSDRLDEQQRRREEKKAGDEPEGTEEKAQSTDSV
jgi:hypothetical protein